MNLYEKLGLKTGASKEAIKRAFRSLAKKNHPDKKGKNSDFIEINQAYQILIDDDRRHYYEKTGNDKRETQTEIEGKIIAVLMSIIESQEFEPHTDDLFDMACQNVEGEILRLEDINRKFEIQIKKLQTTEKRVIKAAILKTVLSGQVGLFKQNIKTNEQDIEKAKEMIETLDDFEYDFDEAKPFSFKYDSITITR